ncbi:hypothetical protein HDR60_03125 [bacterium]|nr:hypothetical protein [bacterium]
MHENEVEDMLSAYYNAENSGEENEVTKKAYESLQSMLKDDFNEIFVEFIDLGRKLSKLMFKYGGDVVSMSKQYSLMINLLRYTNPNAYDYWINDGEVEVPEECKGM